MKKEHPAFIAFWENHWRKHSRPTDGRKAARETFMKHVKEGADPQDIVDGAAWFIRNLKDSDKQFIPLASTWLNRGAYEDMCLLERDYQQKRADAAKQREAPKPITCAAPKPNERPQRRDLSPQIKEMLKNMNVGGSA